MDNFKAVYKILSTLEKAMDLPAFDINLISAQLNDAPFLVGHSSNMRTKPIPRGFSVPVRRQVF